MNCRRSALAALLVLAGVCQAVAAPKNVVLIVFDDLGTDLGCYGNRVIKTRNLDAIAAGGTRFTNAFCTTASCSASRSVILSGMYNHANGQFGHEHDVHHFRTYDRVKTLSARLADAHYRTARAGKFHVGPPEVYPFEHVLSADTRNAVEMADACRNFIAEGDKRPFFLYFCTGDPHRSGRFGPGPNKPNLFGNEGKHPGVTEQHYDPKDVIVPPFLPDTPACRAELAEYYQAVSRADQGVGRLVEILKSAGHWDDTLVICISDNGIPFPGAKTTTYDPGMKLPCLVRNPFEAKRVAVSDAMISWVDIAPTILDFAGVLTGQEGLQGRSFLSVLGEEHPQGWDEIYGSHTFHEVTMYYPVRLVRNRKYKLTWNIAHGLPFPFASDLYRSATWQDFLPKGPQAVYGKRKVATYIHRPQFELYDIENDPDELVNLAADPAYAAKIDELKAKIKAFEQRTKDPWIHKWEYE